MQRRGITKEARQGLKTCYKLVLRSGLNLGQAIDAIRRTVESCSETEHLLKFFEHPSTKGFCIRGVEARRSAAAARPLQVEVAGG
jgi:acyl-[acyl carrier protein]--UDP-N-acetylglucosamine O-acyltransferase